METHALHGHPTIVYYPTIRVLAAKVKLNCNTRRMIFFRNGLFKDQINQNISITSPHTGAENKSSPKNHVLTLDVNVHVYKSLSHRR